MTWAIIGLMAGFILVLVLLYTLLLKTKLAFGYKLLALVVCTLFYWIQYESLQQYTGWPTTDKLPSEFVLIASEVYEPNKTTGETGVMYWWIRESSLADQPPRVYRLPYQAELHQKTEEVIKDQKKGAQYVGKKSADITEANGLGVSFEKISKAKRHKKADSVPEKKK